MEDTEIISLFWSRSEDAITALAKKYGRLARSVAMHLLGNPLDAEECVNDSYLCMWNSLPPNRPTLLSAFFVGITRNQAMKRLKAGTAQKRSALFCELDDFTGSQDATEEELDRTGDIISAFLDTLDVPSRTLFVRRYYYGESIRKAAGSIGITENNASVKLFRIRDKLRQVLEKEGIQVGR